MIDSNFQRHKLENSLRILRYLRSLLEEWRSKHRYVILEELQRYCRDHLKVHVTVFTHCIVEHFANGGKHPSVVDLIPKAIKALEDEWIALGFDPKRQYPPKEEEHAA